MNHKTRTFSQTQQDLHIIEFYKDLRNGYFLDIGACHADYDNNTYLLEKDYGWTGVCLETQTRYHQEFEQKRNVYLEKRAIWREECEIEFCINDSIPGLGGILETNRVKTPHIIKVQTITFPQLLKKYNCPNFIHYVSLDVEGAEYEVLKTFPFEEYAVGFWTIEHGNEKDKDQKITELLVRKGYVLDRYNKQDFYWCHESLKNK